MTANLKTQRLRRYEGDPNDYASDGGDPAMELYSPFGPMIARTSVPPSLVERINAYAETVLTEGQGKEFVLPEQLAFGADDSLASETARLIGRYLARVDGTAIDCVRFQTFWVVSQYASTPSPVHFHSGDLSGVLYLKVPQIADEGLEESKTYISGRQAGYINFIHGGRQPFTRSLISFKPRVGDFYIFPGWLLHGAEPFRGSGERRSLAFNAFVTIPN